MAFINFEIAEAIIPPSVSLVFSDDTTATKEVTSYESYTVYLEAVTSDAVETYVWERRKNSGSWQVLNTTTGKAKQETIDSTGVYTYRCKAISPEGLESEYSNEVIVDYTLEVLQKPIADITSTLDSDNDNNITVTEGDPASFILSGTNSIANNNGSITDYTWEIVNSPSTDNSNYTDNGDSITINDLSPGEYTIKLTVKNNHNLTDSELFYITVNPQVDTGDPSEPEIQILNPWYINNDPDAVLKRLLASPDIVKDVVAYKEDEFGTYNVPVIDIPDWDSNKITFQDTHVVFWAYVPPNTPIEFSGMVDGIQKTTNGFFDNVPEVDEYIEFPV